MTTAISRWMNLRTPPPAATVDPQGARSAAYSAIQALEAEKKRSRQTTTVTESLKALRERNHWADMLYDTMEREPR